MTEQLNQDHLDRLEAAWRSAGAPIVEHLRPGLSADEMREMAAGRPDLHLSEEAFTWWGWHNGCAINAMVGGDRDFMSFEHALSYYDKLSHIVPDEFPIAMGQPPISFSCDIPDATVSPIAVTVHGMPTEVVLPSFGALVTAWAEFAETGLWTYSADGGSRVTDELANDDDPREWVS